MPNRIVRDGILTSERVAKLDWGAEVFYRRLLSVVDDFGRYYAASKLLRSACYPLQIDAVKDADIEKWMTGCVAAQLVTRYCDADGKQYVQVHDFRQQVRAQASKFPAPDAQMRSACVADAKQMLADAHLDVDVDVDVKAIETANAVSHVSADAEPQRVSINGFQPIIDAYHAALPRCLHISVLNPKRKRRLGAVRKLAKQVCEQQGWTYDEAEFFGAYWAECAEDPWMRGEVANPNNPAWKQNLDVLLAEDRFAGVMDRVIERMRADP